MTYLQGECSYRRAEEEEENQRRRRRGFNVTQVLVLNTPPCLAHEAGDHAVEGGALEAEPLLAGAESAEVLCLEEAEGGKVSTLSSQ